MTETYNGNLKSRYIYLLHHNRKIGGLEHHINAAIHEQKYMCAFFETALVPPLRTHKA